MAAVATYWPALSSFLVSDDFQWVEGAMVLTPAGLFDLASRTHFYRPAIETHFALMYHGFGCSAVALHAANITLHAANAALVIALAHALTASVAVAAAAGLLFATQPALAQAVLWPAAVSSVLCASCGLVMLIVDARRGAPSGGGGRGPGSVAPVGRVPHSGPGTTDRAPGPWRPVAVAVAFAFALAAHESGVVFLAAALLLRYGREGTIDWRNWRRDYLPCALLLLGYLGLTVWINSRNYVITEGRYRLGGHVLRNLFDYLVALYQGHRQPLEYVVAASLLLVVLWRGRRPVRTWVIWLLAALAPVLAFTAAPASRYLYMPSIPFSLLVATGIAALAGRVAALVPEPSASTRSAAAAGRTATRRHRATVAIMTAVVTFLVVRSALFTRKGVAGFDAEAAPFARAAAQLQPSGDGTAFTIDAAAVEWMDPQYLTPLARVAACDPRARVGVE